MDESLVESLTQALVVALYRPSPPPKPGLKPKLFWVSWLQPMLVNQPFARPAQVCAWWRSAFFTQRNEVVSACVAARTARQAKLVISGGWRTTPEWRFCQPKPSGWRPNAAEFPLGADAQERFVSLFRENASAIGQTVSFPLASD